MVDVFQGLKYASAFTNCHRSNLHAEIFIVRYLSIYVKRPYIPNFAGGFVQKPRISQNSLVTVAKFRERLQIWLLILNDFKRILIIGFRMISGKIEII